MTCYKHLQRSVKRNKSHGFGAMNLKEIIKTNCVQYSECIMKVGDSVHFSE